MGVAENRAKSSAQAAYMKERGIRRRSGQCPWHCGGSYSIDGNGQSLLTHLNSCQGGAAAKRSRARR